VRWKHCFRPNGRRDGSDKMASGTTSTAVCSASELAEGEIMGVTLSDGRRVALYNVDGTIYATSDTCTHGEASLSEEGILTGKIVECTWHFGTFDVTTGNAESLPCSVGLKTYSVEVRDDTVYVVE
jgi:p-cumate 2,3-dioxygenase ferredoxin component